MKRNVERYFLFLFFFVFTLSLVNISPLFAKKEKEADKTAGDTDVCKRDTTKTGTEQYSAKCKEQCTSTDEKFAKFKADNKEACDLLQALTATTDKPAIPKEEQEIENLVQNVVEKLNTIEDTAENTAALEAIIPEFPNPTSKEFTITFSDKLRTVLEAIIFPQSAPESTATIAFVLNETTDKKPATDDKKPATAEKTPIQARAEAAIKTIILKSFDPLTDTSTGKYYKEVIQELREHWLNVDLKGDQKAKDTPFTVDNFKSAIFGSIGYSLPHELYHFEFDEALTKAIKDHAEADTAKKAFLEAYKKYIETNTKIEIQSNSWEKGESLEFKISLNYDNALLDPGTKCTDAKFTQFQKDNTEVCKLVAVAAKAATDSGTAESEAKKAEAEKNTAVSKSNEAKNATTSTDALAAAKLSEAAAKKAEDHAKNAETARDRIPSNDTNYAAADQAAKAARGFAETARTAANEAAEAVITKAEGEADSAYTSAAAEGVDSTDALVEAKKADTAADNAKTALALISIPADSPASPATIDAINIPGRVILAAEVVITKAKKEAADFAQTAAGVTPANVRAAGNRAAALLVAAPARTAADNAEASAKNAEAALLLIPVDARNHNYTETAVRAARNSANDADASADAAEAAVPNS